VRFNTKQRAALVIPSLRFKVNAPHIVHEIFEDHEAAIINLKSGNYYSLNPVGAEIWSMIDSGVAVGEIHEQIASDYVGDPVDMNNAVDAFIALLQEEELIVSATVQGDSELRRRAEPTASALQKSPFRPPVIERFNDMQELLLLDPIHEVEDTGWPNRKQDSTTD
jgi:hypothetical protein